MYFFDFMDGGVLGLNWWQLILATLALTHVTIAAVTIFLHRAQAHRALDLHPIASHFFRLWLWLTTGMQTIEWVAVHRKHHAKCETEEDPHSPQVRGLKKVFWEGSELYIAEAANAETLARYGHGTPNDWVERNVYSRFTWQGVGVMLGINWILFGWVGFAVWGVQMMWIPIFAAGIINGVGHYWGYRNYDVADASANIVPWAIIIGGEELHNNHHTYPTSARLSSKWYEFDLGWMYIRILERFGLAKVLRVAPVPKVERPRAGVDLDTLQAVISNRYDLLARYARDLRHAYREELEKMRVSAADRQRFVALKRWLRKSDVAAIPAAQQQTLREMLAHSGVMKTLVDMRAELATVWSRSATSREQMLAHLQDWITRAEASGIRALQETALRIRSYAPARITA
jgi:stearoyl-CoA desaturase (delta-9 desaturase)